MDFDLTREQEMIRKMVREFAEKEIAPVAMEYDEAAKFPEDIVKQLGQLGLMGMTIPRDYGGAGVDTISYAIAIEELSRIDASIGTIASVNNSLACEPIFRYGNEEQKRKYLTKLASGEGLGAFALTEAGSGSDASAMQSTAVNEGEEYVLNGSKVFVTNGTKATAVITFALTDKTKGYKGISAFIVPTDTKGFVRGVKENKMGIRASDSIEISFEDCRLSKENLLGKEGEGFKIALATLDVGRIGIAAQAVGIAQGALDESLKYSKEREQFGQSISSFQAIQWMLADMATEIEAARLLTYRAAYAKDHGERFSMEASMAKLYASDVAVRATRNAVQIHGGYGYTKDYPVERFYRDAKVTEIYEGTSEVQRLVISRALLK